jgi:hypothetical protein
VHIRHEAARQGWTIFSESTPAPTRDVISVRLEAMGLPPVAERTYDHYRRLARHGVDRYMPINDFDMALKRGELGLRRSA